MKSALIFFKNKPLKKAWLMTLLDLMLLMLTFFIMLYSMSTPNISIETKNNIDVYMTKMPVFSHVVHLNYLEQILSQKIKKNEKYHVFQKDSVLHIQIPKDIFKNTTQRSVLEQDKIDIQNLGELLNNISNKIILRVAANNQQIQENLLQGAVIANLLKQGGYTSNLRIIQSGELAEDFFEIIIFPQIRNYQ